MKCIFVSEEIFVSRCNLLCDFCARFTIWSANVTYKLW